MSIPGNSNKTNNRQTIIFKEVLKITKILETHCILFYQSSSQSSSVFRSFTTNIGKTSKSETITME